MLARLTERRAPQTCRHPIDPAEVVRLVTDVAAVLERVQAELHEREGALELRVTVSDPAEDALRQAFVVALATFRAATDGWVAVGEPTLEIEVPDAEARVDRVALPLSLYGGPSEEGAVRVEGGAVHVVLPAGPADRLGRLAAVLAAVLGTEAQAEPPVLLRVTEGERRWRGMGARGRATRLAGGEVVQRRALALLEALEPDPALRLQAADRVLLREELTGALHLPVDRAPMPEPAVATPGVRRARVDDPPVSIILAAHREEHRVMLTVEALRQSTDQPYEVVIVDDGSDDGCCDFVREAPEDYAEVTLVTQAQQGSARARNSGVLHARAPTLVFMDAHCFPRRGWLDTMLRVLDDPSVGIVTPAIGVAGRPDNRGYGLTIAGPRLDARWLPCPGDRPHRVPAAGAGCIAMGRGTLEAIGGFEAMRRYGVEDVELSIRCWLAGFDVVVEPRAEVGHWFKERASFELPWTDYLYNVLRTAVLHFDGPQLRAVIEGCAADACFGASMALLLSSDIWERRARVRTRAVRDGAWYCERFGIDLSRA